jgi:exodeoxyribonuclease V beta subunit
MTTPIHPVQYINFTQGTNAYVVEASAGTGKTWTIERLYIKALLEASDPSDANRILNVENILVVTFTNDATDELKERLYAQIEKSINLIIYLHNHPKYPTPADDIFITYLEARQDSYKKDVTILTMALQSFDQSAIFTIHGFCNKVLHDYQFECGVNPEFELVKDKSEIFKQIVLNFLRSQILTAPQFADHIDTVMNNLNSFFSGGYELTLVDRIVNKLPKDLFKIDRADYVIKYQFKTPSDINFLSAEINTEDMSRHKTDFLAYLINYIHRGYREQSQKSSQTISYDELIQKMADSLANSNELADKIFHKYPIAFIDEFQDTDLLQWQIFGKIYHLGLAKDIDVSDSNRLNMQRGNVVVVGDPKQAIYRFRGADIDTYIDAKSQMPQHLNLVHNYRSRPNIMNFINQLFDLSNQNCKIENSYLGHGIDYSHTIASSKNLDGQIPGRQELVTLLNKYNIDHNIYDEEVQLVSICGPTKPIRNSRLLKAMTFEILALLSVNPSLKGKIAVLVTKNREAVELVKYFSAFGIKAAELKLGNIFATGTARELYSVLNSLLDLANRQNFMRAFTTKIFNLSIATLADKVDNPILELYHQRFFKYSQIWESFGIFSLIYAILDDIASDQKSLPNRELANLWQLAELLNKSYQRVTNRSELLFWFKDKINQAQENQIANIDAENEELIRLENDDEQIIITTQHKAKGMEYEILFCPYFKSNITLDGTYDFNYRRPFFSNYRKSGASYSELVLDREVADSIVQNDNKEIHRLNYVALTRAKSRIYIYMKQNTITKTTGKYNSKEKPDKLIELFGYVKSNPKDTSHLLFNYPEFFGNTPQMAIKDPKKFPGVAVYNRDNITEEDLQKLRAVIPINSHCEPCETRRGNLAIPGQPVIASLVKQGVAIHSTLAKTRPNFTIKSAYYRQSYSGLTKTDAFDKSYDYYEVENESPPVTVNYKYKILNDKNLSGAVFGTLFHELCEIYPFSQEQLELVLHRYNVENNEYKSELIQMLKEAFSYPLLDGKCLSDFSEIIHELEFNLTVSKVDQIHKLISKHFGKEHPFSVASLLLHEINPGFLLGFMDVCFLHNGKYWVLDYKTNGLTDYTGASTVIESLTKQGVATTTSVIASLVKQGVAIYDHNSPIIESMAEHHYYLQYLLYLVALKRYLQVRLQVADATDLIGGSVYYYVRGIYTDKARPGDGIFIDDKCQQLVRELDKLLS